LLAVDPKTNIGDYKIIATSLDKNNKGFIDIVKHNSYPFYGFQGHPEINNGELLDPFLKVVKASFNRRKKTSFNKHKRSATVKNSKNSKLKTLKLRVLKY
jgi:carbamoylphosphate synthase small subunit